MIRVCTWLGVVMISALVAGMARAEAMELTSPDGRILVRVELSGEGMPSYSVSAEGRTVLERSPLGLVTEERDLTRQLRWRGGGEVHRLSGTYEVLASKRRVNTYEAAARSVSFDDAEGNVLTVEFRVFDDGVAFRMLLGPGDRPGLETVEIEATGFVFPARTDAWMQPMSVAKTGWEATNPSYEEFYEHGIAAGTRSPLGAGWAYPALFRVGGTGGASDGLWALITETGLHRRSCGTRLVASGEPWALEVGLPDPRETMGEGAAVNPTFPSREGWTSPWRVIAIGDLGTIVETNIGLHVAAPSVVDDTSWIETGRSSWSWVLLKDENTIEPVQREFIDYAAEMGWEYCLIDCDWDRRIGDERMEALAQYALSRGVEVIAWYNSAGAWNTAPYTPRDRLLTPEDRDREFARLAAMGVAGVKVDFFGGDGQSVINHYIDIFEAAARHELVVNCHGATLPRGWSRTYPHLLTVEAVKGLEFTTFEQRNADRAPRMCATVPFVRNVFDPMDYTPVVLDAIPNITRRSTAGFELALSVLFMSGIQHYGEIPGGMQKAPGYVRTFLSAVPPVWEDTVLLDGFPGRYAAMARRSPDGWYAAGINADTEPRTLTLDFSGIEGARRGRLIEDGGGDALGFRQTEIELDDSGRLLVTMLPRGGFVIDFD